MAARNEALADLIKEAGVTYESLARDVTRIAAENGDLGRRPNRGSVAHWIRGVTPSGPIPAYLSEALSRRLGRVVTPEDLGYGDVGQIPDPFDADPMSLANLGRMELTRPVVRRSVLFSAALLPLASGWLREADERGRRAQESGTIMVGEAEIATVRQITAAFNAADETLGGGHGRDAVVQYLVSDVASYLHGRFRDEKARAGMFGAAAELAYLAGWKAHDMQMEGIAQRYYAHALQLAHEAADPAHAGWVLRILSHQALDLGEAAEAVGLAENAWKVAQGRVSPATEALWAITAARANASAGNRKAAARAIHQAENGIADGHFDEVPSWAALAGNVSATVTSNAGKSFAAMGDHASAEARFTGSANLRASEGFRRAGALNLTQVAEAQAAQGHAEEACQSWQSAFERMTGVNSARHRAAIGRAQGYLRQYAHRKVPGAPAVDAQCHELLASPASA